MRPALADRAAREGSELGELVLSPDERGLALQGALPARAGTQRDRFPRGDRLRLALQGERLELDVVDRVARGAHGPLADRDRSRPAGRLQASGDVDGIADHGVAVADRTREDLSGVDADAQREADAVGSLELLVQFLHRPLHAECGAHGALLVVLVGDRCAEERHHVVADVLVDRAAVFLDLLAESSQ